MTLFFTRCLFALSVVGWFCLSARAIEPSRTIAAGDMPAWQSASSSASDAEADFEEVMRLVQQSVTSDVVQVDRALFPPVLIDEVLLGPPPRVDVDPFAAEPAPMVDDVNDGAIARDPFAPDRRDPFAPNPRDDDPFGGGADPFGDKPVPPVEDPFGENPFAEPEEDNRDPFTAPEEDDKSKSPPANKPRGDADPFGPGGSDPFAPTPKRRPKVRVDFTPATRLDQSDADIEAALAKPARLEFIEVPLNEVVDFLRDAHKINIDVDQRALDDEGLDGATSITFLASDISLENALQVMLKEHGLTFYLDDGALVISTPEMAESQQSTEIYSVADLAMPLGSPPDAMPDYQTLVDVLQRTLDPESWDQVGGPGSIAVVEPVLVVTQDWRTQRKVAAFLDALRQVRKELVAAGGGPPKVDHVPVESSSEKINKALAEKTTLEFIETPLADVIDYFSSLHDIEIQIDRRSLDDVGLGEDTPITRNLKGITLRSALNLMLRELDLTFTPRGDVLLITTPEESEAELQTRLYPVAQLVLPMEKDELLVALDRRPGADYDTLIDLITATVGPTTWEEVGGPGAIEPIDGVLAVSQTPTIHAEINALLATLRDVVALGKERPIKQPLRLSGNGLVDNSPALAALEKKIPELVFVENTLQDAVDALKHVVDFEIQIDIRALQGVGIGTDTPLTGTVGNESLRSALTRTLKALDLTVVVRDEVIIITTPEETESSLITKAYDAVGLISSGGDVATEISRRQADELISAIATTVRPTSWDRVGGPGSIMYEPNTQLLFAAQTEDVHREIAAMLSKLRVVQATVKASDVKAKPVEQANLPRGAIESDVNRDMQGNKVYLKIYRLNASPNDARDLQTIVHDLIEPKSWDADEAYYVKTLSTALVVRHTAATHRKIHTLLGKLEMLEQENAFGTPANQGFGSGGLGVGSGGLGGGVF